MKKNLIVLTVMFLTSIATVSAQGIEFKKLTFEDAQKMAQKEGKLIFIDMFTEWCGPCKTLSKNVFTKKEVGDFFNKEFISLKIDAEKEGVELAKKYKVKVYPTLLYILPNGELTFKTLGSVSVKALLVDAKKSLTLINDPNSLTKLNERYEAEKNNEQFMLMYINKIIDMKENPTEQIEYFLSYQKGIKHRDVDMMEFLLKHSKYIRCNTYAEKIYLANIDEYLDIATKSENRNLLKLRLNMVRDSRKLALYTKDAELYEAFIEGWDSLPPKDKVYADDINYFNIELLSLGDDRKLFKKEMVIFLDSLVDSKSPAKIAEDDIAIYETTKARYNGRTDLFARAYISSSKDLDAGIRVRAFTNLGKQYLKEVKKRKEYKVMAKWIDFGKEILPGDHRMMNLEADVLYVRGKKKDAIKVKKAVLKMLPKGHRDSENIVKDLTEMENSTFKVK